MCKGPLPTTKQSSSSDGSTTTNLSNNNDGAIASSTVTNNTNNNTKQEQRVISKKELQSHNTSESAWTVVHGKVYDITPFLKHHPGGDLIVLCAGIDGTILFETYHPRTSIPQAYLLQSSSSLVQQVGVINLKEWKESYYTWSSDFYPTLKRRVLAKLAQVHKQRRGGTEILYKAILLLIVYWYAVLHTYTATTFFEAILYMTLVGIIGSFIGTCIQHDGNHGSFSMYPQINKWAGWTLDMIGSSAFTWEFQHMLGHHPYTNVLDIEEDERKKNKNKEMKKGGGGEDGKEEEEDDLWYGTDQESDPDVFSSYPLMRMHPSHSISWYHAYQHLYAPILFAFMTLAKCFQQDYEVIYSGKLYHIDATCRYGNSWNVLRFILMKCFSTSYMMILPIYYHGWIRGLCLAMVGHLVCGELLATMFIVNHVIEGVAFGRKNDNVVSGGDGGGDDAVVSQQQQRRPTTVDGITPMEKTILTATDTTRRRGAGAGQSPPSPSNNNDDGTTTTPSSKVVPFNDWAAVQCQTSVNWSSGSWFWNHFSGGLCHQIEHHLFPSICHTNYVYIQDVVELTCHEFGVPYQNELNLVVAYRKMMNHLKIMGQPLSSACNNSKKDD